MREDQQKLWLKICQGGRHGIYDYTSPFFSEFIADNEARDEDQNSVLNVNGKPMGRAIWNLIITKRDLTLWCKIGMKPTRTWKVTPVKKYFGIKGTGEKLLMNFMQLHDDIFFLTNGEEHDDV